MRPQVVKGTTIQSLLILAALAAAAHSHGAVACPSLIDDSPLDQSVECTARSGSLASALFELSDRTGAAFIADGQPAKATGPVGGNGKLRDLLDRLCTTFDYR